MAVQTLLPLLMNAKDEEFFKALGARIAQARKDQGLTQQQLADQLGIPRGLGEVVRHRIEIHRRKRWHSHLRARHCA